jgi:hypothetical protein
VSFITGAVIVKRVRDAIVLNLRRIFASDPIYTYSENPDGTLNVDCSKIGINDATPATSLVYPSIICSTASGEETRFLQEDFFSSTEDAEGNITEIRGAPIVFQVTILVTSLDTITRDEVLDKIYRNFKIITDDLADNGIGIIKTSLETDRREFVQDRWLYTSGVRMSLYGEWIEEEVVSSKLEGIKGKIYTDYIQQEFRP